MQDRKREGRGFAGAGLCDANDVARREREWDCLGLDRCRSEVVFFAKRSRDGIGEAEILKGGQKMGLSI